MQTNFNPVVMAQGREHWAKVGDDDVFLWEKPTSAATPRGTILFVHGSSMASQPSFDLRVPGVPEASGMDFFASQGFNTWCFDCRGYGRSTKTNDKLATIADGAADAAAAANYIRKDGAGPLLVYGISSGALRAARFAQEHPDHVARLALDAFVWTGKGSPTLEQRAKKLDQWRASPRREINRDFILSIFNRDHPGTVDDRFVDPFIEQILALDDSVPNGTYIDMCANLPVVDPLKITCPTLIMRGQYDGIAGLDDLLAFFAKLVNYDKEFAMIPEIAHATFTQKNFMMAYQILYSFLTRPARVR